MQFFALVNARAAYCVKNKIDCANYSMSKFYLDILQQNYPPVFKISKIKLEFKCQALKYTQCIWKNCKKTSKTVCNNENCRKLACKDHMAILCSKCFTSSATDISIKMTEPKIQKKFVKFLVFAK